MSPEFSAEQAAKFVIEDHRANGTDLLKRKWYYGIELSPGVFTNGCDFENVHLTRQILKNSGVEGRNCLDVGCMECLVSVLLKRRGADQVTAYDRLNFKPRIDLIKRTFDLDFNYIHGISFSKLPSIAKVLGLHPFDVVVFSGVLYHMLDPLAGLATARGLLRNGGLLILETAAIIDNKMAMYFNADARFYPGDNFWLPSIECLDYLLRFLRLSAVDCIHFKQNTDKISSLQVCRICVPCRAVDEPLPCAGDSWISSSQLKDFREFLDWEEVKTDHSSDVVYTQSTEPMIFHPETGSVNLYETVQAQPESRPTNHEEQIRLKLGAVI